MLTLNIIYLLYKNTQMKATIKQISHGNFKGQFRFTLKGNNNEIIATSESYTQKHNVIEVLEKYFSNFEIIDKTKKDG